jgi:transcriptional regulator with XRE-family HTH domain
MDSFTAINNQIKEAKEKREQLIRLAMDGRTQRSISEKTGIHETKLSKWINGLGDLEASDLEKITHITGVSFK